MADQSPGGLSRSPEPRAVREEGVAAPAPAQPPLQVTGAAAAATLPGFVTALHTADLATACPAGPPKPSRPAPMQPRQFLSAGPPLQQHIEPRQQPQAQFTPGLQAVGWEQWPRGEKVGGGAAGGPGPAGEWGGRPATYGGMALPPERLGQLLATLQGLPPQQAPLQEVGVAQQGAGAGTRQPWEAPEGTPPATAAQAPAMAAAAHPMGQRRQELEQLWAAYGGTGPEDTQRFVAALRQQQQQHRLRGGEQVGGEEKQQQQQQQQSAAQRVRPAGGSGISMGGEGGAAEGVTAVPKAGAEPVPTQPDPIAPSPFLGRSIPGYQAHGPQNPVPGHQEQHQHQQQGDSTTMLMVPTLPLEERPARSTSLNFQLESSSFSLPLPQPSLPQAVLRPSPGTEQQVQQQQQRQQEQQLAVQAGGAQARQGTPALQGALLPPPQPQPAAQLVPAAGADGGAVGCTDGRHCPGDGQEEEAEERGPPAALQPAMQPALQLEGPPAQQAGVHGDPQQEDQQQQAQEEGAAAGTVAGSLGPEPTLNPAGQPGAPLLRQGAAETRPAAADVEAQPLEVAAPPPPPAAAAAAGEAPAAQLAANPHLQLLRVLFSIQVHIEAALLGVQAAVSADVPQLSEQVAVLGQLQAQEDPWLQQLAAAILRILQSVQQWVSTLAPPPAAAQPTLSGSQRAALRQQEQQQAEQGLLSHQGPLLQLAPPPQSQGDAEAAAEALVSFMSANPPPSGDKPSARPVSGPRGQLPGPGLAAAAVQQGLEQEQLQQQQLLEQQAEQQQRQLQQQAQLEQLLVARAVHKRRAEEVAAAQEGAAAAEDVWGPPPKRALTQALMWGGQPFPPGTGQSGLEPAGPEGQQMSPANAAAAYGQQLAAREYFPAAAGEPSHNPGSPPAYLQLLRQRLALLQQQQQQAALPPPPQRAAARAWAPQQPAAAIPPMYQQAEAPPALTQQWGPHWAGPREAALAQAYQPPYQAAQQAVGQGVPLHGYGYPSPGQQPQQGWLPPQPQLQLAYQQPPPGLAPQQPAADPPEHIPWDAVRLRALLHHQQQQQQLQQQLQGEAGAAFGRGHQQLPAPAPGAPDPHQAPLQWPPPQAQQQQQPLWEGPGVDHLRLRVAALAAALGSAAAPPGMGWEEQQQAFPAGPAVAGRQPLPAGIQGPGGWAPTGPLGHQLGQAQALEEFYVPRAGPMGGPGPPHHQQQQQQQPLPGGYPSVAAAAEPSSARAPTAPQSGWAAPPPQLTPALAPAGYQAWGPGQQFGQGGGATAAQRGVHTEEPPPPQQQQQEGQRAQQEGEADPEEAAAMAAQLRAVLARYFAHGPPGPGS